MPKMGGDDDKEKKEDSPEGKAEKEAAVRQADSLEPNKSDLKTCRKKLLLPRRKSWRDRGRKCMRNRNRRGKKREQNIEKRFRIFNKIY